uniref:Uncharacterized protein n=1 Tax=uncultured prokaryote TaxID=198431 RepID=A0A0H5QP56_9ZZZZ|nr:hypothetical protein [uncultured prokaryote]
MKSLHNQSDSSASWVSIHLTTDPKRAGVNVTTTWLPDKATHSFAKTEFIPSDTELGRTAAILLAHAVAREVESWLF